MKSTCVYKKHGLPENQEYFNDTEASGRPVPFNFLKLTLTIYGMASLQPGDIFRVNYLPKIPSGKKIKSVEVLVKIEKIN